MSTDTCNVYMIVINNWLLNLLHFYLRLWNIFYLMRIIRIREYKLNLPAFFTFFGFMKPFASHQEGIEILCFRRIVMPLKCVEDPLFFWFNNSLQLQDPIKVRPVYLGWKITIVIEAYLHLNSIFFWFWQDDVFRWIFRHIYYYFKF